MSCDFRALWKQCLEQLSKEIDDKSFNTWLRPINIKSLDNDVLILEVPNMFFYEWVGEHYVGILSKAIRSIYSKDVKLRFVVKKEQSPFNVDQKNKKNNRLQQNIEFINKNFQDADSISGLNDKYVFDNFIEGDCNRLARSAAISIAEKPLNNTFNPLLIYGGVGLGKTHLMQAIGNKIKEQFNDKIVVYLQTTVFINQFINCIRTNCVQDFSKFYSSVDVLLLDDVQFLKDKGKTQEMLFFIFNQLHQLGKQIVLTSDRPPRELSGLQDRLISRFCWGLTVNITMPDVETKIAILKSKAEDANINDFLIEYIAQRVNSNIRELEGIMLTAIAKTSSEHDISVSNIQEVIDNIASNDVEVDRISYFVAEYFKISIDDLLGPSKQKDIAFARKIAMYFAKKYTQCTLKRIGSLLGGRDHSTVIHAINNINELIKKEQNVKNVVDNINKEIIKNFSVKKNYKG
ncbi:MAG: chromosomal replication initiator protein DnaA [Cytophagales bacterium]|nr:chromosomal replication initiator protein DnaA [Cytophagales bacterium]